MLYDTIIIGGGAAGLSAALYNGRYGHKTLALIGEGFEGSTMETWGVENYPGYLSINGTDLIEVLKKQAQNVGAELKEKYIHHISKKGKIFSVHYNNHYDEAKTIIYAAGTMRRKLGVPNEDILKGKGISYCATCDGPLFRNKLVGVVGGGDSAAKAALILAEYTEKVYIIIREESFTAEPINIQRASENPKIEVLFNSHIDEFIENNGMLAGAKLHTGKIIDLVGLFIEIGGVANTEPIKKLNVEYTKNGYIKVDCTGETNLAGFFAAGDVSDAFGGFKQIITAAAGGVVASHSAHNYLVKNSK
ncbi:MAG: FAD-dependent oxidoreductase [bacterium]|nr:FAD-dependent oxidoreductase [bacterium]